MNRMQPKPENIREVVWRVVDTDISIKKDLSRRIINLRALANYIIGKYKLKISIDSVISALRRYPTATEKHHDIGEVYSILKKAKIKTFTKMAYISVKKTEDATKAISKILSNMAYNETETIRILEGSQLFKLVIDNNKFAVNYELFSKKDIVELEKKIGMIEMIYPESLKRIPGVFSAISTELGENEISIIDALICSNEHVLVVFEKDLLKAFEILYNMCN